MKKTLLLAVATCALLNSSLTVHAAPPSAKRRAAQICAMCQDKSTRIMMIRELMSTKEGKLEMAQMLEHDAEFRSYYEAHTVNPG